LYSEADIAALMAATGTPRSPLRRATFAVLIGLLAVSGIRVGEAIALDRSDVDLNDGRLLVRHGKFGKTPELVLHPTTVAGLHQYQRLRDRLAPATGTSAFFVFHRRDPAALLRRPRRLPPTGRARGTRSPLGNLPAPHSRLCRSPRYAGLAGRLPARNRLTREIPVRVHRDA